MKSRQKLQDSYDVVISGMGGAGLAAAWEAASSNPNARVLIINDRSDQFIRENIISVTTHITYLLEMLDFIQKAGLYNPDHASEDAKFDSETQQGKLAVKSIERFIKRRLDELKAGGFNIEYAFESELSEVDLEKGIIKIAPSQKAKSDKIESHPIHFKYVVSAEGNKRHAFNLASQRDKRVAQQIQFEEDEPLPRSKHFSIYLIAKNDSGFFLDSEFRDFFRKGKFKMPEDGEDNDYAYLMLPDVHSFDKSEESKVKFSLSGELPDSIDRIENSEERKAAILDYAQQIVKKSWHEKNTGEISVEVVAPSVKYGAKKDNMKLMEFTTHITEATTAAIQSVDNQSEKRLVLIGDSVRSANYQVGSGMTSALSHAKLFGQLFRDEITLQEYNQAVKKIAEPYRHPKITPAPLWVPARKWVGAKPQKGSATIKHQFIKKAPAPVPGKKGKKFFGLFDFSASAAPVRKNQQTTKVKTAHTRNKKTVS